MDWFLQVESFFEYKNTVNLSMSFLQKPNLRKVPCNGGITFNSNYFTKDYQKLQNGLIWRQNGNNDIYSSSLLLLWLRDRPLKQIILTNSIPSVVGLTLQNLNTYQVALFQQRCTTTVTYQSGFHNWHFFHSTTSSNFHSYHRHTISSSHCSTSMSNCSIPGGVTTVSNMATVSRSAHWIRSLSFPKNHKVMRKLMRTIGCTSADLATYPELHIDCSSIMATICMMWPFFLIFP